MPKKSNTPRPEITPREQVSIELAEERGILDKDGRPWSMQTVREQLAHSGENTRDGRRRFLKSLHEECLAALAESDEQLKAPTDGSRARVIAGTYADPASGSDDEPLLPASTARSALDAEFVPPPGTRVSAGEKRKAAPESGGSSSESSEDEPRDDAAAPPPPDQPDHPDPQMTEADLAEISDPHPIPFPPERQGVRSPEAQKMIDTLQRLKADAGAHGPLWEKVRDLLKEDAVPMEHQKRTAQFLHTAVSEFNMAGNGLPCGMGKTFATIMYVLNSGTMGVICGKKALYETWRREIARVMPEGSYAVIKIGPSSFGSIGGQPVHKAGVVKPLLAALREGRQVFLYVQMHVLNTPYGVLSLIMGMIEMAPQGATLIVEESHEQCRKCNVPGAALAALSRVSEGTVFVSATPIMTNSDEAKHMFAIGNGKLPRGVDPDDALKVWRSICFQEGAVAMPPLSTWLLRVPPVEGLEGLAGQARSRASIHGNGIEAREHSKYLAGEKAVLTLLEHGCSPFVCMENRKGATQFCEMLRPHLEKEGVECFVLSGETTEEQREIAQERVRELHGQGQRVVVCATPQVGGAGLNLQPLSAVLLMGLPWSKQDMEQIVARVHRIGQLEPCICVAFVTGAADQEVLTCIQDKMRHTRDFYGDQEHHLLPSDHIESLGVCAVEDVGRVVCEMRESMRGSIGPTHAGASKWALFTKA